uniref:Phage derived protein Gp49-like (DUF891) n=1 Tax=Candidatus Kentrum sp. FW TaxID=2126338 RepID=A0A450SBH9_9GAMM|nr:MAG: Phage derived protein Gp49-like (DUF891) [Candidatus Kentron sp. FW]
MDFLLTCGFYNFVCNLFTVRNTRMVLLHGIEKKSRKTPRQEIELARTRKNQYFSGV